MKAKNLSTGVLLFLVGCGTASPTIYNREHPSLGSRYPPKRQGFDRKSSSIPAGQEHLSHRRQRTLQTTTSDRNTTHASADLRSTLLDGYDKNSFPWEYEWGNATTTTTVLRTGLPVQVGLNFHKVKDVNVAESTADLVVWIRMSWSDPRLSWNPQDYGNLTSIWFWTENGMGGNEASEIWVPDIYLWNQEMPLSETMDDTYASVSSSGLVFWSRPGRLKATCRFRGLKNFPFDSLKCTLELGSWSYSGLYVRPTKMGGTGYSIGGSETAGQSFAEFNLTNVECEEFVYPPFPSVPEEDWPVLLYHVTFARASEPYVRGFVMLQILLNLCAFGCFWMPPQVGERMGLAITSLLAAVASELTVAAKLPAASELNWFVIFAMCSMFFNAAVIVQSTVVIYFYYYTGDDLIPTYIKWLRNKKNIKKRFVERQQHNSDSGTTSQDTCRINNRTNGLGSDAADAEEIKSHPVEPHELAADDSEFYDAASVEHSNMAYARPAHRRRESMRHDANDFLDERAKNNNARWQKVAIAIDEFSRVLFPSAFVIFMAVIFPTAKA